MFGVNKRSSHAYAHAPDCSDQHDRTAIDKGCCCNAPQAELPCIKGCTVHALQREAEEQQ